jgi:1-acyl-sn-glycerol-3-phosphate acyltransferase
MTAFWYWLTERNCFLLLHLFARFRKINCRSMPKGPLVVAGNHISHFDPPALSCTLPRQVDFMAMQELFETPVGRTFCTAVGCFPVSRNKNDTQAVRTALERLKAGRAVFVFAEGGLRSGADSVIEGAPLPPGAAVLAQMAKCPVQTCLVIGTDQLYQWRNLFRRPRLFVILGPVLECDPSLPGKEARTELNNRIAAAWRTLYQDLVEQESLLPHEKPATAQARWANGR